AAAANTISGNGLDGVGIFNGSNAYVFSNTIQGNTRDGVLISRASGRLLGSNTIRGNHQRGVEVNAGQLFQAVGDFNLTPTVDTIENNDNDGLGVFQGASADVQRADIVNNGNRGVTLSNNGSLRILLSTISGNTFDGVGFFNGSSLLVNSPTVTISNNGQNGVNLFDGASADIQFASITGNNARGVIATTGSKLRLLGTTVSQHANNDGVGAFDGTTVLLQCTFAPAFPSCAAGSINQVTQNHFNGVNVSTGSTGILQGVTISNTTGAGVRVDTNSTLRLQTASTQITNNSGAGINVSHASTVNFGPPAVGVA